MTKRADNGRQLPKFRHAQRLVGSGGARIQRDDHDGLENLAQYILRNPFSLEKMTYIAETGEVIYRSKRNHATNRLWERFDGPAFIAAIPHPATQTRPNCPSPVNSTVLSMSPSHGNWPANSGLNATPGSVTKSPGSLSTTMPGARPPVHKSRKIYGRRPLPKTKGRPFPPTSSISL